MRNWVAAIGILAVSVSTACESDEKSEDAALVVVTSTSQIPPVWIPVELFGQTVPPAADGVGTRRKVFLTGAPNHGSLAIGDGCVVNTGTFLIDGDGAFTATITSEGAPKVCPGAPAIANRAVMEAATELRVDAQRRIHVFSAAGEEIGIYRKGKLFHAA